ncbi:MAG: HAD-IA family hydrolase [Deltaproteobacteria bacterium]|nr:HAD-IA family hydrolase [Deltaproteobacteria bacterium]
MPLPPVILLDLDDTIVSFSASSRDFWREAYETYRAGFHTVSVESFLDAIQAAGNKFWKEPGRSFSGRMDLVWARREVVRSAFNRVGLRDKRLEIEIADYYTWEKEAAVAPLAGAVEALDALRKKGIRLALVSNGSSAFQRDKLSRFDLDRFFEITLIEGELGYGKPDPRIFRQALSQMGVPARDAWMVGDNLEADIAGAKRIGLFAVWNDYARIGLKEPVQEMPDLIINHLSDLLLTDRDL